MPAPTLADCYKIEQYVETGLATVLNAETGIECFTSFSTETLTTPRIEIVCLLGESLDRYALPTIDGEVIEVLNTWQCTFEISYFTNPTSRGASAAQHSSVRGEIRAAMGVWRSLFTTDAFPYHVLGRPIDVSTEVSVNNEEDEDVSVLTFTSPVNVRADAWPETS